MIVNTGDIYRIFDDSLKTFDKLPANTYRVGFSTLQGFYLEKREDIEVNEKIYGVHDKKVEKVFNSFKKFDRNLGIILSGDKGIGKSLFAKMVADKAIENEIPVVIVDSYIQGIANFIDDIKQEIVVIFDEFDKTFSGKKEDDGNRNDPQSEMLTLFDGTTNGKKMFIITCNNLNKLSDYMLNRPGRFHYHFRFDYPNSEEIKSYLMDKNVNDMNEINEVIAFSSKRKLNFDCLRAIAFELNSGFSFKDAIQDLNIINLEERIKCYITCVFENGERHKTTFYLDMFGYEEVTVDLDDRCYNTFGDVTFIPENAAYDYLSRNSILNKGQFSYKKQDWFEKFDVNNVENSKEEIESYSKYGTSDIAKIIIKPIEQKNLHYMV